jgi:hypothetical protein
MTRQNISTGTTANDGTGDTLRSAGQKINENFVEIYQKLGPDSDTVSTGITLNNTAIVFEGSTPDDFETTLSVTNPTKDNTINLPDSSGEIITTTAVQDLHRKTLKVTTIEGKLSLAGASGTGHYLLNYIGSVDSADPDRNINLPAIADSDTLVFNAHTATLTNKTLTSPVITTAKVGTSLNDTNGAELIKVTATGSAINEITLANAAASGKPTVTASGGDTDVTMKLAGKGTGSVEIAKAAYTSSTITANGAASTAATYIICNKGSALTVSIADGTVVGEYKIITNKGAGAATVTPANFAQGANFTLAQYDGCQIVWDGTNWYLIGNQGEVTVA